MLLSWLLAISIVSILFLIATGILSALSLNSSVNGNPAAAVNFAWWSVGVGAVGVVLILGLLIAYAAMQGGFTAGGLATIGIIAILFLLGAVTLSVFAARGTVSPIADFPLWAAVVSFVGALLILIFTIFYMYTYWFEIVYELETGVKEHRAGVQERGVARYTPIKSPKKVKIEKPKEVKVEEPIEKPLLPGKASPRFTAGQRDEILKSKDLSPKVKAAILGVTEEGKIKAAKTNGSNGSPKTNGNNGSPRVTHISEMPKTPRAAATAERTKSMDLARAKALARKRKSQANLSKLPELQDLP